MKETPFTYHDGKLGVRIRYLISDKDKHPETLGVISYRSLKWRLDSKTRVEKRLRRGCFNTEALVEFYSLPTQWRDRLTIKFGNPPKEIEKSWFAKQYVADREAFNFYMAYRYGGDKKKLSEDLIEQYTYNASVLNTVLTMKLKRKAYIKSLGYVKVDIWQSLSNDVNSFREVSHNLPTTKDGLRRKTRLYQKEGYGCLVSGKLSNTNSKKITTKQQQALIDELIAKHTNLDNSFIADVYNHVAKLMGHRTITAQTVSNRKRESMLVTYAGRNGKKELSNHLMMQHKRKAPSNPMLYWTLDGWNSELLYQKTSIDKNGYSKTTYHNRKTIVVVLDPFNKYPIGFAIGDQESPKLIKEALRNALRHTQELFGDFCIPYQLQTDNYAIKKLTPLFKFCSMNFTPAQVGNAKAKVIEPYFNYLNRKYCKLHDNWSGYNVSSGSKNQPNAEVLNKIRHRFPDELGVVKQLTKFITIERSKKMTDYVKGFENISSKHYSKMDIETYLSTIGETTGYTNRLKGEGMVITINGVKQTYDCFDLNFRKHIYENWTIKYDPTNLSKVLAVSQDTKYQFLLEKKYVEAVALADRNKEDVYQYGRINDFNKQLEEHIIKERKNNYEAIQGIFNGEQLNDTLAKHLLVDSAGQHKDNRNKQRQQVSKDKVISIKAVKKEEKKQEENFYKKQQAYHKTIVDVNDYLD